MRVSSQGRKSQSRSVSRGGARELGHSWLARSAEAGGSHGHSCLHQPDGWVSPPKRGNKAGIGAGRSAARGKVRAVAGLMRRREPGGACSARRVGAAARGTLEAGRCWTRPGAPRCGKVGLDAPRGRARARARRGDAHAHCVSTGWGYYTAIPSSEHFR